MANKLLTILSLLVLSSVLQGNPSLGEHGKVLTRSGVKNPHLGVIQSGSSTDPKITMTSPHGKIRVDTKDGPIFIGQIGPNNGRGEDGRGDPIQDVCFVTLTSKTLQRIWLG